MTASNYVLSSACPAVTTNASGRQFPSVARWTFVVRPPRDRLRASSSGSPADAPFSGRRRRTGGRGRSSSRPRPPVQVLVRVGLGEQRGEHPVPGAVRRPRPQPVVGALPRPELRRQVLICACKHDNALCEPEARRDRPTAVRLPTRLRQHRPHRHPHPTTPRTRRRTRPARRPRPRPCQQASADKSPSATRDRRHFRQPRAPRLSPVAAVTELWPRRTALADPGAGRVGDSKGEISCCRLLAPHAPVCADTPPTQPDRLVACCRCRANIRRSRR
jgi:hypothetical protein